MASSKTESRSFVKRLSVPVPLSNEDMEKMGDRVRMLRMNAKDGAELPRPELAKAIGMPLTTLQTLEDKSQEKSAYAARLAAYFGVSAVWLECRKGAKYVTQSNENSSPVGPNPATLMEADSIIRMLEAGTGRQFETPVRMEWLVRIYDRLTIDGGKLRPGHFDALLDEAKIGVTNGNIRTKDGNTN